MTIKQAASWREEVTKLLKILKIVAPDRQDAAKLDEWTGRDKADWYEKALKLLYLSPMVLISNVGKITLD